MYADCALVLRCLKRCARSRPTHDPRPFNRASPVPILSTMEMNGVAHIQLTVRDFAACRVFYAKLFSWLDMQVIFDSPQIFYGVGSRTGIAISPADERFRDDAVRAAEGRASPFLSACQAARRHRRDARAPEVHRRAHRPPARGGTLGADVY